jgi:hypothetical protein
MEVCVGIDEELLCGFDRAALARNITRIPLPERRSQPGSLRPAATRHAIWVVHAFQKKSTRGIETPKHEIDLVKARIKRLKEILR